MLRPILLVTNAGRGETPPCPAAIYQPGDVVKISRRKALAHFPAEAIVACAIPPGFAPEYALADLLGEARPLMVSVGRRVVSYILVNEGDGKPYLALERDLSPSGKPPVMLGTVSRAAEKAGNDA